MSCHSCDPGSQTCLLLRSMYLCLVCIWCGWQPSKALGARDQSDAQRRLSTGHQVARIVQALTRGAPPEKARALRALRRFPAYQPLLLPTLLSSWGAKDISRYQLRKTILALGRLRRHQLERLWTQLNTTSGAHRLWLLRLARHIHKRAATKAMSQQLAVQLGQCLGRTKRRCAAAERTAWLQLARSWARQGHAAAGLPKAMLQVKGPAERLLAVKILRHIAAKGVAWRGRLVQILRTRISPDSDLNLHQLALYALFAKAPLPQLLTTKAARQREGLLLQIAAGSHERMAWCAMDIALQQPRFVQRKLRAAACRGLRAKSEYMRRAALRLLHRINPKAPLAPCAQSTSGLWVKLLRDPAMAVHDLAATLLPPGRIPSTGLLQVIATQLKGLRPLYRRKPFWQALSQLAGHQPTVVAWLFRPTPSNTKTRRKMACRAMAQMPGHTPSSDAVARQIVRLYPLVTTKMKPCLLIGLQRLGPRAAVALSLLRKALQRPTSQRHRILVTIGAIGPKARVALPMLRRLSRSRNSDIAAAAVTALGQLKQPAGTIRPLLWRALRHKDWLVRLRAATALAAPAYHHPGTRKALLGILARRRESHDILAAALKAFSADPQVRRADQQNRLVRRILPRWLTSTDHVLREAALSAITSLCKAPCPRYQSQVEIMGLERRDEQARHLWVMWHKLPPPRPQTSPWIRLFPAPSSVATGPWHRKAKAITKLAAYGRIIQRYQSDALWLQVQRSFRVRCREGRDKRPITTRLKQDQVVRWEGGLSFTAMRSKTNACTFGLALHEALAFLQPRRGLVQLRIFARLHQATNRSTPRRKLHTVWASLP